MNHVQTEALAESAVEKPTLAPLSAAVTPRRFPVLPECVDGGPPDAPCAHTECRYHLAQRGHWQHHLQPTRDCAIDVANEGPRTLEQVATILGLTAERIRQVEEQALEHLKHDSTLRSLRDE